MANKTESTLRQQYEASMLSLRVSFEAGLRNPDAGTAAVSERSAAVDRLVTGLWTEAAKGAAALQSSVGVVSVGGYGRAELFPFSDVDLLFLLPAKTAEKDLKEPIARFCQQLWDCGLRLSPLTRTLTECGRFHPENVEFNLSLLDARFLAGRRDLFDDLTARTIPSLVARDGKKMVARLVEITRHRHARYGETLFHLEPNIKDCPGGLRDAHVCAWMDRLAAPNSSPATSRDGFFPAREFLLLIRTFLHLRHGRDDNTLDWTTQDAAAALDLGGSGGSVQELQASYWMRTYFRHARVVLRSVEQALDAAVRPASWPSRLRTLAGLHPARPGIPEPGVGIEMHADFLALTERVVPGEDPAHDPEIMMAVFAASAKSGLPLSRGTEERLEEALPQLSAHLEDGPGLWRQLERILLEPYAGKALRSMHAIGLLELILPEFHGIDALVIRDAYHRYTVDEHTFVVLDTLHGLSSPARSQRAGMEVWAARFASILRDLRHPGLLYLGALLHDTGKGHSSSGHAVESMRMAAGVTKRLELDTYESDLVFSLIREHLEMSASLRRDVFAPETVRALAAHVVTPEALKMLTLFTYADISAVHPDALTPWKAEKLHHLYLATLRFLDRSVEEDRVGAGTENETRDVIHRVAALVPGRERELHEFLAGFPQRYLLTRTREEIHAHFQMSQRLSGRFEPEQGEAPAARGGIELMLRYDVHGSEMTLVGIDQPMLFASMAGALAGWGMNIVTADAFSNARHVVVDTFRFLDEFRTLEMNESERERFVESVRRTIAGEISLDPMLKSRTRSRRRTPRVVVQPRIHFDEEASTQSTLLEVTAQDTPGLLYTLAAALAENDCSIEVALIDTEGEMAIDVFYLRYREAKVPLGIQQKLQLTLMEAMTLHVA